MDPLPISDLLRAIPEGRVDLARAVGFEPVILDRLLDKAIGLIKHNKREEGEALLERLVLVDNLSPTLPFILGGVRSERADYSGAIAAYDVAIERAMRVSLAGLVAKIRFFRAQALLLLGHLEPALNELEAVKAGGEDRWAKDATALLQAIGGAA